MNKEKQHSIKSLQTLRNIGPVTSEKLYSIGIKTPEQFKAWSQNLGHEKVLTTFLSYGQVASARQGDIMQALSLSQSAVKADADEIADAIYKKLRESGITL